MQSVSRPGSRRGKPAVAWTVRAGWLLLVSFAAGCGAELYEQRLSNSSRYFAHLELLSAHLHDYWADTPGEQSQIKLRVPRQFLVMAPPKAAEPAPGEEPRRDGEAADGKEDKAEPAIVLDERQPSYLNVELPGLRGAFFASLKVLGPGEATSETLGWIYVLTNHHLYNGGEKAGTFHADLVATLSEALQKGVAPEDWHEEKFPAKSGSYSPPVRYKSVVISPNAPIAGYETQFSLYMYEQGDVDVAVLFVLPKDVDSSERLTERIPFCLETLRVAGDQLLAPRPGAAPASPGGGGAPANF